MHHGPCHEFLRRGMSEAEIKSSLRGLSKVATTLYKKRLHKGDLRVTLERLHGSQGSVATSYSRIHWALSEQREKLVCIQPARRSISCSSIIMAESDVLYQGRWPISLVGLSLSNLKILSFSTIVHFQP